MSSTTPKTLWSEQEKIALMMSIIAASGPPNWSRVVLPAGRSRIACTSLYNRLVKEASTVPMAGGAKAGNTPKRTPKKTKENGTPTKRKRGGKGDKTANEEDGDDEEDYVMVKKQKKEEEDEGGEEVDVKEEDSIIKEEEEEVVDGEVDYAV